MENNTQTKTFREIIFFEQGGDTLSKYEISKLRSKDHQYFRRKTLVFTPTKNNGEFVTEFELRIAECSLEDQFTRKEGPKIARSKAPILTVKDIKSDDEFRLLVDSLIFSVITLSRSVLEHVNSNRVEFLKHVEETSAALKLQMESAQTIEFTPEK